MGKNSQVYHPQNALCNVANKLIRNKFKHTHTYIYIKEHKYLFLISALGHQVSDFNSPLKNHFHVHFVSTLA